jgi:hypothetical protein
MLKFLSVYIKEAALDKESIILELEAERDRLNSAIAALQGSRRNTGMGKGNPDE